MRKCTLWSSCNNVAPRMYTLSLSKSINVLFMYMMYYRQQRTSTLRIWKVLLHCDEWDGVVTLPETQVCHRSYIIAARSECTFTHTYCCVSKLSKFKPHLFVILTVIGWFILNIQSDLFWHRCLERQAFGTPRMYTLSLSQSIKRSNYEEFLKVKNVLRGQYYN
jgi:hypothetical protein